MTLLNKANAIYLGDQKADAVYLGSVKVWPPPPGIIGTPIGLLLAITGSASGIVLPDPGTTGTPVGLLLAITKSIEDPPGGGGTPNRGSPIGLLLGLTKS
jgi:hypothetical protein